MNDKLSKRFYTKRLKKELTPKELDNTFIIEDFLSNFSEERSYGGEILLRLDRQYKRSLIYRDSYIHIYASYNGARPLTTKEMFLLQLYL